MAAHIKRPARLLGIFINLCSHLSQTMSTSKFPTSIADFGYGFNNGKYYFIILYIVFVRII